MSPKDKNNTPESEYQTEDRLYNTTTEVTSDNIRSMLGSNADFISRAFLIRDNSKIPATLAYIDGLVNSKLVNDNVLKPLAQEEQFDTCKTTADAIKLISMGVIYSSAIKLRTNLKDLTDDILGGSIAIIFNDGKLEQQKLADMVAYGQFIVDRLYENGDVMKPSSKE